MIIRCAEVVVALLTSGEFTRVPSGTAYEEISFELIAPDAMSVALLQRRVSERKTTP
jgi:hypothetical protein